MAWTARQLRLPVHALGVILVVGALGPKAPAAQEHDVLVFAAASLKTALDEVNAAYQAAAGGTAKSSYAASSALARQIEQGAPADLFISADLAWMDYLAERDLIKADTRGNLLGNRIVLIGAPDAEPIAIEPGFDLAGRLGDGRLAMADTSAVPAGKYGKAALEALGAWAGVESQLAQAENVRAALALVSTGEAPLGIVYQTDAAADPKVKVLGTFPQSSHPPIIYPAAITAESKSESAGAYLEFLQSPGAAELFRKQGFTVLDSTS